MPKPVLVDKHTFNSYIQNVKNENNTVLKCKKSNSLILNWAMLFVVLFIVYLLYKRFKNTVPNPDKNDLPKPIRENDYHRKMN